jgi:hypothetical protein
MPHGVEHYPVMPVVLYLARARVHAHARVTSQVRDTRMNSSSSRSHQVVRIAIESRPATPGSGPSATATENADHPQPTAMGGGAASISKKRGGGGGGGASSCDGSRQEGGTPEGLSTSCVLVGSITFVDLAGSERLSQAAAQGGGGEGSETHSGEKLRQKEVRSLAWVGLVFVGGRWEAGRWQGSLIFIRVKECTPYGFF